MNKKVCLTTLEFPPDVGGVGESVSRIARMLVELDYEVHVVVFRAVFRKEKEKAIAGEYGRSECKTSERDGILVHRLHPAVRSRTAKEQDYLCDLFQQLKNLHQQYQFNVFHAFFINEMGFLTTLLAKEIGIPVINSIRGADLHKHIFSPPQFGQIAWTLAESSWLTFVSADLQKRARAIAPEIETKSSTFWNSIVPIDFDDLPRPELVDRIQGTAIASVGSFRDKKGLEYLLDACKKLSQSQEITLILVGDFVAKEREYWQQEILKSGLGERLIITGKVSRQEALAYLPHIDIFAIPSLHDGCPNALLEAMLAAKAIVGTNVDAIGEIITDELDGLLVDPQSSEALLAALQKLIDRPHWQQQLGIAARQKVLQQLAPAKERQNWEYVYNQVLGVPQVYHLAESRT